MKKDLRLVYSIIISIVLLLYVIAYRVFLYPKLMGYSEAISASFAILLFGISMLLLGFRKHNNDKWTTNFIKIVLFSCVVYFIGIYAVGIVAGFLNNSYSLDISSIVRNMSFPWIILICVELFRYVFVKANREKLYMVFIITGLLYLFEINFYIKFDSLENIDKIYEFVTSLCIPILLKNILCSYLSYHGDYRAPALYRMLTELYVYFAPVQPNLSSFITSITSLVLPFVCLLMATKVVEDNIIIRPRKGLQFRALDIPVLILFIFFACTIFGIGPYKLIGIETGSMAPAYQVGDGVIVDKNYKIEDLKVDDVIMYESNDHIMIIHRIKKINSDGSFITQGDANNTPDSLYVTKDKVRGVVRIKIPFIAYPALLFK